MKIRKLSAALTVIGILVLGACQSHYKPPVAAAENSPGKDGTPEDCDPELFVKTAGDQTRDANNYFILDAQSNTAPEISNFLNSIPSGMRFQAGVFQAGRLFSQANEAAVLNSQLMTTGELKDVLIQRSLRAKAERQPQTGRSRSGAPVAVAPVAVAPVAVVSFCAGTPTPSPTPEPTAEPTPIVIIVPIPTPNPGATATPAPTSTPEPTPEPTSTPVATPPPGECARNCAELGYPMRPVMSDQECLPGCGPGMACWSYNNCSSRTRPGRPDLHTVWNLPKAPGCEDVGPRYCFEIADCSEFWQN